MHCRVLDNLVCKTNIIREVRCRACQNECVEINPDNNQVAPRAATKVAAGVMSVAGVRRPGSWAEVVAMAAEVTVIGAAVTPRSRLRLQIHDVRGSWRQDVSVADKIVAEAVSCCGGGSCLEPCPPLTSSWPRP